MASGIAMTATRFQETAATQHATLRSAGLARTIAISSLHALPFAATALSCLLSNAMTMERSLATVALQLALLRTDGTAFVSILTLVGHHARLSAVTALLLDPSSAILEIRTALTIAVALTSARLSLALHLQ